MEDFEKLTIVEMEEIVSDLVGERVIFQGKDSHAYYFDNEEKEYKIVIDQDEKTIYEREHGKEDWYMIF